MTTELERRLGAGLREYADAPVVARPPVAVLTEHRPRRPHPGRPALVALAVLVVLVLVPLLLPVGGGNVDLSEGPARLPQQFASFSFLTGDLAAAPIDRAVAVYVQRNNALEDYYQDGQALLLDADGERYRRTRAFDRDLSRLTYYVDGLLLSPDGRRLVYPAGQLAVARGVSILDVSTGSLTTYSVPPADRVEPLAWSPDGRRLAYVATDPGTSSTRLMMLDVDTGHATELPAITDVIAAAFSPDGSRLAVQIGREIVILDPDGRPGRRLALGDNEWLAGQAAWSPDGALLAVLRTEPPLEGFGGVRELRPRALTFVAVDGTGAAPAEVPVDNFVFQGWRTDGSFVYWDRVELVAQVPGTDARTALARTGDEVLALQLAYGLLRDAVVVEDVDVDRGPWPTWARLILGALLGIAAIPALLVGWRLARRRPAARPR